MDRLQTWVINLDRAPDRLERISMQLQRLGLPFTRLPAVDARALTADQRAALDEAGYRRKHGMDVTCRTWRRCDCSWPGRPSSR
jgi:glycosyl transferase family 25